jgi:glycosyltransferase involved in cell wall biosynthesis
MGELLNLADRAGVGDRVLFTGPIPAEDLSALYRWAELVVAPSLCEGFGITLLEGFAHSRPVVASRIPAHEEVGGDQAVYFDPRGGAGEESVAELADVISSLLRDEERRAELSSSAMERVYAFDWGRSARKLQQVYWSLLEQGR